MTCSSCNKSLSRKSARLIDGKVDSVFQEIVMEGWEGGGLGASAEPTGLGSSKEPEPHPRLGPTGAIPSATPYTYAYRYPWWSGGSVIRFNNGQEVNGSGPIEAIPLYTAQGVSDAYERGLADGRAEMEPTARMARIMGAKWVPRDSDGTRSAETRSDSDPLGLPSAGRQASPKGDGNVG